MAVEGLRLSKTVQDEYSLCFVRGRVGEEDELTIRIIEISGYMSFGVTTHEHKLVGDYIGGGKKGKGYGIYYDG